MSWVGDVVVTKVEPKKKMNMLVSCRQRNKT
jgi:hypothetical protein